MQQDFTIISKDRGVTMILAVITYPITGPLAEILFVLEMLIAFFSAELALLFLYRYWKAQKNLEEKESELLWTLLLAGWSGMWGFIGLADFIVETPEIRVLMLGIALISCGTGMFLFTYLSERRRKRGFVFTILFAIVCSVFILFFLATPTLMQPFAAGEGGIFIGIVTIHLVRINRYARIGPKFYFTLVVGNGCLYLGFLGTMGFIGEVAGTLVIRVFLDCVEVAGLFLLAIFFTYVTNFSEFNWRDHVKFIILFEKDSGMVLFSQKMTLEYYNIGLNEAQVDEYLVASALTGVKLLLEQIHKDKENAMPVKSFKQENAFVCLEYGEKFACVAICERPSPTLERLMKVFLRKVDVIYQNALKTWNGDSRTFDSIKYLFKSIFLAPNISNPNVPMQ